MSEVQIITIWKSEFRVNMSTFASTNNNNQQQRQQKKTQPKNIRVSLRFTVKPWVSISTRVFFSARRLQLGFKSQPRKRLLFFSAQALKAWRLAVVSYNWFFDFVTHQGINISHLGNRKIIFKSTIKMGYVSFQEGNPRGFDFSRNWSIHGTSYEWCGRFLGPSLHVRFNWFVSGKSLVTDPAICQKPHSDFLRTSC